MENTPGSWQIEFDGDNHKVIVYGNDRDRPFEMGVVEASVPDQYVLRWIFTYADPVPGDVFHTTEGTYWYGRGGGSA